MLPLHGQDTAAARSSSLGRVTLYGFTEGNVFVKQSKERFAEFLFIE
jgi:hypothetical protein